MMFTNKRRLSQPALSHLPGDDGQNIQMLKILTINTQEEIKSKSAEYKKLNSVTLDTIVDNLINKKMEINSLLAHTLFTTYVLFSTSENLVKSLFKRFLNHRCKEIHYENNMQNINEKFINHRCIEINYENKIQSENEKIFAALIFTWIESYPADFDENLLQIFTTINFKEFMLEIERHIKNQTNKIKIEIAETNIQNYQLKQSTNLISFPKREFSEQLTLMDQKFFTSLNLRHCLASWEKKSLRNSEEKLLRNSDFEILRMTSAKRWTTHFNSITRKVVTSIVKSNSKDDRIRVIEKWVDIALELRQMKNLSSLKAIISALHSAPVHKLTEAINKAKLKDLNDLDNLCNYTSNYQASRQLLLQEGTSMSPLNNNVEASKKDKLFGFINNLNKANYDVKTILNTTEASCGTIPYLGMFLTDLVMIDTAYSDPEDSRFVNLEKRKKEFEVLSHLKLLQSSASSYRFSKIQGFEEWFRNLPEIDEKEAYKISLEISQSNPRISGRRASEMDNTVFHSNSISSTKSDDRRRSIARIRSEGSSTACSNSFLKRRSLSMVSLDGLDTDENDEASVIVRFYLHKKNGNYKSLRIKNDERTRTVIKNVLNKFRCYSPVENYFIQQCLDNIKCAPMPDNCNVFHALRRTPSVIPECLVISKS